MRERAFRSGRVAQSGLGSVRRAELPFSPGLADWRCDTDELLSAVRVHQDVTVSAAPSFAPGPLPSRSPQHHRGTPDATLGRLGRGERAAHPAAVPGSASGSREPAPSPGPAEPGTRDGGGGPAPPAALCFSPPVSTHELAAERESPLQGGDGGPARNGTGAGAAILARTTPKGDCLIYTGPKNRLNGYGRTRIGGRMAYAHRVVYEAFVGPIPPGFYVCHRCDTPSCVRPSHLFAGSSSDNFRDAVLKGRNWPVRGTWQSRSRGGIVGGARIGSLRHGQFCLTIPGVPHRPAPGCRILGGHWTESGRFVDTHRRDGLRES